MGNLLARFRHRDVRIILLGLDSAGKTTILYRLKLDDLVTTIPTIGFNVESIQYKDLHLTAWDIGSRDKIRPLFRHYYKGADAVVFVIDSHDRERLDELNYDVIKPAVTAEELTNAVFLFLANKVDLPDTMSIEEISEKLGLRFLKHPWGILPVSAISGEGLQSALEWLALRLGSVQVKPRNFTAAQSQTKVAQDSKTTKPQPSNNAVKTDSPNTAAPAKPVILVNSKLVNEARKQPSPSSVSMGTPTVMTSSSPANCYSAFMSRKTPGTVINSFSSYSIAQSMKEDLSRRKFSAISKSDLRKMSCASLMDSPNNRKFSTCSLMDYQNPRKLSSASLMDSPARRKASTTFVIEPVQGKFSSSSFMEAACARKFSASSLGGDIRAMGTNGARKYSAGSLVEPQTMEAMCERQFVAVPLSDSREEAERPKMSLLSADTALMPTPSTAKLKSDDLTLGGLESLMADYNRGVRHDSETSADADLADVTSPSDHIQPHLRPLGLKKSPFLSNSAKYVVNSIEDMRQKHYNEIIDLLPERYTSLYARDMQTMPCDSYNTSPMPQFCINSYDNNDSSTSQSGSPINLQLYGTQQSSGKQGVLKTAGKQSSQDSDSLNSSNNGKRSNLDLFCTPSRKPNPVKHSRTHSKDYSTVIVPSSSRPAYCSRAYSAMKCLFFRPTKEQMQHETNSLSSDDDKDKNNEDTDKE